MYCSSAAAYRLAWNSLLPRTLWCSARRRGLAVGPGLRAPEEDRGARVGEEGADRAPRGAPEARGAPRADENELAERAGDRAVPPFGRRVGDDHAELGVAEARRADAPGGAADLLAQDAAQAVEDADHAVARRRHAPAAAAVEAEAHTGRARAAEDLGDPELPGGVHVLAA